MMITAHRGRRSVALDRLLGQGDASGGRFLFVASSGGHLTELDNLVETWGGSDASEWVTFDTPQSRALLRGRRVHHVPYVAPRDVRGVMRASRDIRVLLQDGPYDAIVSTGAAVALSAALAGVRTRTPMVYVESIARLVGPSLTGRLLSAVPGVQLRTQVETWADRRWTYAGDVLGAYDAPVLQDDPQGHLIKLFVTLGTIEPYRFDALVDAVLMTGLAGPETVWQLGSTTRQDLPGTSHHQMAHDEVRRHLREADVVVSHGGVGTILDALAAGKVPVVSPRRERRSEHVDDHQEQFARHIQNAGLAVTVEAPELTAADLRRAARLVVPPHRQDARGHGR